MAMVSEDDSMSEESDFGSENCDSYGDNEGWYGSDGEIDADFGLLEVEADDPLASRSDKQGYVVLNENDILHRQKDDIERTAMVLTISEVEASILLRFYKWRASEVPDEWFANEDKVRRNVGLLEKPVVPPSLDREITCGICFEFHPSDKIASAACGHPYCTECWAGYISTAVNDGPGCLTLRCPDPPCIAVIGHDMINKLAPDEAKKKYNRYLVRSYIEDSKKTKWCPAPGCEYAISFAGGSGDFDVTCLCSHSFCWDCTREVHRPVDCDTVAKWILKNNAESENMTWILAHAKACPQCKRPIEKNHGCMHMTCTPPCSYHFCWLCLGPWSRHGVSNGGYYACNRYEEAKAAGEYDTEERVREMAKNSLDRYMHYYERWASNESSRKQAIKDLERTKTVNITRLSVTLGMPETQLEFVIEAWHQIIECRRILKWTYAFGYYLPQNDLVRLQFFEYSQGEAEAGLERLHHCTERELVKFYSIDQKATAPSEDFNQFRTRLTDLTKITKNYFGNLVKALENGLADVEALVPPSESTTPPREAARKRTERTGNSRDHEHELVN